MPFCWSSFVSGGYKDNTCLIKFVKNAPNEERTFYDLKNHYLCLSPLCTKDIESILRSSHGEILTEKKVMRRAAFSIKGMISVERSRYFGVLDNYDNKNWTVRKNRHSYYSDNTYLSWDEMIDKPNDPILIDYTHYYYKEENPTFGIKCISLIKRQSNKDNKIYYVMIYSSLNFDVAIMFLQKLLARETI